MKSAHTPSCLFLRRGRYYLYRGDYKQEALQDFALESYDKTPVQGPVPGEPALLKKVWRGIINLIETYSLYVNNILMIDQATG